MQYRLKITRSAYRAIRQAPSRLRNEVMEIIRDLRDNPRPEDSKGLQPGRELHGLRAIRVDGWRIVYQVKDDDLIVTILAFKKRGADTYLNL